MCKKEKIRADGNISADVYKLLFTMILFCGILPFVWILVGFVLAIVVEADWIAFVGIGLGIFQFARGCIRLKGDLTAADIAKERQKQDAWWENIQDQQYD